MQIAQNPSPNFGDRRGDAQPNLIVLHYTAMQSTQAAVDRLCDPECEVSAHYVISEKGAVVQLVDEALRAWHAGVGSWGDVTDINSNSIGIELANNGAAPFAWPQINALEHLARAIMQRWSIAPERIIAHSDMAPGRKFDPGARFDWQRLARLGLSVWPESSGEQDEAADFRTSALRFGYTDGLSDDVLLQAFRLRFRPWCRGVIDATDRNLMFDLATRYPVALRGSS